MTSFIGIVVLCQLLFTIQDVTPLSSQGIGSS